MTSLAVYSEVDADTPHVHEADIAFIWGKVKANTPISIWIKS